MKKVLPTSVFLLCKTGALVVGGFAKFLLKKKESCDDYDLIVPPEKWYIVSLLIPANAKINKHGGFRFTDDIGIEIDIWPCSIEQHLIQCKSAIGQQEYVVDYINSRVFTSFILGTEVNKKEKK